MWAQASTAPSRLFKNFTSEGGIRVCSVVKAPAGQYSDHWKAGGFNRSFSTCMDMAPTFLDMISVSLPKQGPRVLHRGRPVHPMMGKSWKSYMIEGRHADEGSNEEYAIHSGDHHTGWELLGRGALRSGDWKIVHIPKTFQGKADPKVLDDPNGWELFNIVKDPGETMDLSEKEPEKLKDMLGKWDQYVKDAGLVWGPDAMTTGLSETEAPHLHDDDFEIQKTWMQTPAGRENVVPKMMVKVK